ncbi:MAG: hypothetical protein ABI315_04875 [Bacteroidia bacterium]
MFLKKTILIVVCVLSSYKLIVAQQPFIRQLFEKPLEKVILSTDRTIYFIGESIFYKANIFLTTNIDSSLSNVLYLEIYDKDLNPVIQKKEQISNGSSYGVIDIPPHLITGNYYIRAYTQYLRNFSKNLFYTNQLTIINSELPAKDIIETVKVSPTETNIENVEILPSKTTYSKNSLITIDLKGENNVNISVSVVKKGAYETSVTRINNLNPSRSKIDSTIFYPEIRSVSISGKVIDKSTGKPLDQILVYASIIDSNKQFHITRTKEDGSFIFSLPNLNENHEVYISAQKQKDKEISILVNRDFDTDYLLPNYISEKISTDKIVLINEMYANHQITNSYKNDIEIKQSYMNPIPEPFSEKSKITLLKDYIALPTLTEIFKEITSYTTIKDNNGKPEIHVFNSKDKTDYPQPLVLLDNIPFQDHSKLLALPPSRIYSIEVVAQPFIYGEQMLFGVVNIKTVNGNFGGLDLPTDIAMVNYITYSQKTIVSYDDLIKNTNSKSHNPDFRNTLYWNPNISLAQGLKTIQFYASDYEIIISGLNNKGELIYKTKTIQVSQ